MPVATGDPADDLRTKVLASLERSGYPLELRVAAALLRSDALDVSQSRHYIDVDSRKIRECDVVACWRETVGAETVFTYFVIECKSKPRPWVAFDSNNYTSSAPELLDTLWTVEIGDEPRLRERVRDRKYRESRTLLAPIRVAHALVDSKVGKSDQEGESQNRDGAWEAIQAAVSAARGFEQDIDTEAMSKSGIVRVVILPVVVTSGRLFRGWLGQDAAIDLEEVQVAYVKMRPDVDPAPKRCAVVTEEGLLNLVSRAQRTASSLLP